MNILGINAYHGDSSACLVKDGQLIAAVEEERFRRIKHWAGFPSKSIAYCLNHAGIALKDINHIAINQDPKANLWRKICFTLLTRPDFRLVIDRAMNKLKRKNLRALLKNSFPDSPFTGQIHEVEHHLAHLSSAFYVSPYQEAVAVSVDGFGDFASVAWGIGMANTIEIKGRVYFPHSLGLFYQALTQYLGFPHYGDEYKVMGLAPYGKPSLLNELRDVLILTSNGEFCLNLSLFSKG